MRGNVFKHLHRLYRSLHFNFPSSTNLTKIVNLVTGRCTAWTKHRKETGDKASNNTFAVVKLYYETLFTHPATNMLRRQHFVYIPMPSIAILVSHLYLRRCATQTGKLLKTLSFLYFVLLYVEDLLLNKNELLNLGHCKSWVWDLGSFVFWRDIDQNLCKLTMPLTLRCKNSNLSTLQRDSLCNLVDHWPVVIILDILCYCTPL